jgi:vitamin B12 transporter
MSTRIFLTIAVVVIYGTTSAQDSAKVFPEVVITATKFPFKQNETGKVMTVITQEQLQKNSGKTLGEILNQQAGLNINGANNTLGTNLGVNIQGASSANTLILMDGVPMFDPSGISQEFDLNNLSLNNIARIEILKGAQSTLYGSDAVAGVINIITKLPSAKAVGVDLNISAGSYSTYKGSATVSGTIGKAQTYLISWSGIRSEGFSSAYDSTGVNHYENDGFDQQLIRLNYGIQPINNLDIHLSGKYNVNNADIDAGPFADDKDFTNKNKNLVAGIVASYKLNNATLHFNHTYNIVQRDYKDDSLSVGGFATFQKGRYKGISSITGLYSNWQVDKKFELLTGVDYVQNSTDQNYLSLSPFGPFASKSLSRDTSRSHQYSGYASIFLKNINGFNAELGGRWNHHSIYGDNFTYSFNPSYLVNKFKLFANISSGYRVPTLYQLYSEFGNKDLQPEKSVSLESGVQYSSTLIDARVVVFKRDIKNVYAFYTDPNTFDSRYINEDKQKDHGAEASVDVLLDKLTLNANYTFVDGKIYTKDYFAKDTSFNNLFRRPKNTFNFMAGYQVTPKFYTSAHLKVVSKSFEGQFNAAPIELKGYYLVDVYGEYRHKHFKFFTDLQNVTDQKYFDVRGFNSKRFNFTTGVRVNF